MIILTPWRFLKAKISPEHNMEHNIALKFCLGQRPITILIICARKIIIESLGLFETLTLISPFEADVYTGLPVVNNNWFFMNRRTINGTSQCCEACTSACMCDPTPFPGRPVYTYSAFFSFCSIFYRLAVSFSAFCRTYTNIIYLFQSPPISINHFRH